MEGSVDSTFFLFSFFNILPVYDISSRKTCLRNCCALQHGSVTLADNKQVTELIRFPDVSTNNDDLWLWPHGPGPGCNGGN